MCFSTGPPILRSAAIPAAVVGVGDGVWVGVGDGVWVGVGVGDGVGCAGSGVGVGVGVWVWVWPELSWVWRPMVPSASWLLRRQAEKSDHFTDCLNALNSHLSLT